MGAVPGRGFVVGLTVDGPTADAGVPNFTVRSGERGWGTARAGLPSFDDRWPTEVVEGSVDHVLARSPRSARAVRVVHPDNAALVLGRGQPDAHVDRAAASNLGLVVVRRASGGSAVLVVPGQLVWIDVIVPAGDPLWDADVGRAAWWLGERWAAALSSLGVSGTSVHHGRMRRGRWAARVCFDGAGSGELTIGTRKVVGIAQRRTAAGALFQCAALIRWDPAPLAEVLRVPVGDLLDCGVGVGELVAAGPAEVEEAFLSALG